MAKISSTTVAATLISAMAALTSVSANAQVSPQGKDDLKEVASLRSTLDSIVEPANPVFDLLGVSPNNVTYPSNPKDAALSFLNALDQNGNFQTGLALEISPYLLAVSDSVTYSEYRSNKLLRQFSYVQVAAGVAKGANSDDKSAKASLGLIWTPINGLDPYANARLGNCASKVLKDAGPTPPPPPPGASKEELKKYEEEVEKQNGPLEKSVDTCLKQNPLMPYNTTTLKFSAAPLFVSQTGETKDFKYTGMSANALLSIGLSSKAAILDPKGQRRQFVLSASYRENERVPDPNVEKAFLNRDRWNVGVRYIQGRAEKAFYSLEAVYQRARYPTLGSESYLTFVAGADIYVAQDLWLSISAGTSTGQSKARDSTFIGSTFKWGFGKKPVGN